MSRCSTQDAEPADERWLERLLGGFGLAEDVAIVYGPYRPRPDARGRRCAWSSSAGSPRSRPTAARRWSAWSADERARCRCVELIGRRGFFTDANACLARAAWERVPFREVPYAEDRVLAIDMLRAGYAKAFVPDAAVLHSHDYTTAAGAAPLLRRVARLARGVRLARARLARAPDATAARGARAGPSRAAARRALAGPPARDARWRSAVTMLCASRARCSARGPICSPPRVRRRLSLERRGGFRCARSRQARPPMKHPEDSP